MLGDVTGKGVEAAALTSLVRHGARFLSKYERSPSRILVGLNEALSEQPGLWLCTAVCVRLERERAVIASAGHPAAAGRPRRRPRTRDRAIGPILGAWTGEQSVDRAVPIAADETLFLYTDGVIDTLGEHERFGIGRLKRLLAEHAGLPPERAPGRARGRARPLPGRAQADDTAALALRPMPAAADVPAPCVACCGALLVIFASADGRQARWVLSPTSGSTRWRARSGLTIKLAGELDSATSAELVERFEQAIPALDGRELVIDLGEVSFIDSSGMRAIIVIERRAGEEERSRSCSRRPRRRSPSCSGSRAWPTGSA